MSLSTVARLGGVAFVVGNLLFILNKLNEMSRLFLSKWMPDVISEQNGWLILIGQLALVIGYMAYYLRYAPRFGRFGKNALRLFCGGGILLAIGHAAFIDFEDPPVLPFDLFILVLIGLAILLLGLILFGVANLRQPVLARWQWLPLVTGVMGLIGFFLLSGEQITAVFLVFRTLFALGLIGLGLVLGMEKPLQLETIQ